MQAVMRVNVEQASKRGMRKPTRRFFGEGCHLLGKRAMSAPRDSAGVVTMACIEEEDWCNTGRLPRWPIARPTGHPRGIDRAEEVAERPVVPLKSGNADGGKGPQFKRDVRRSEEREIG
jgi:hypothetical protein